MFNLDIWKEKTGDSLKNVGGWLEQRRRQDAPLLLYGYLSSLTLMPLATAMGSGDALAAGMALASIFGGVGGGLVANKVQQWAEDSANPDETTLAEQISREVAQDEKLRAELDTLLEKLAVIQQAQADLPAAQQQVFIQTLRAELQQLGNLPRFAADLSGTGSIAQDHSSAATATQGSLAISGDNNQLIGAIINLYQQGRPEETDETTLRRQIADYLQGVVNRYSRLELRGIKQEGEQVIRLDLEQVYVPLAAKTRSGGQEIKLDQVLQRGRRVIITGGPGSGKTTVLLHLASTLALALGSDTPTLAEERLGLRDTLPLPIYIPLSSYARYRRDLPKSATADQDTLAAFISHYLIRRGQGSFDLPPDFFQQLLRSGKQVMVLLDGLDEVPGENERVEVRQAIEGLLDGRPDLQIVATCRTAAYGGRAVLGRNFREVVVLPLTDEHIGQLVHQAYALPGVFGSEPGLANQKSDDLLQAINNLEAQRRRLYGKNTEPLITSPLLVRMLMIVHLSDRRLPDQRAELYKKATDNLLLPEFHPDQEVANELGGLVGGSQSIHRELAQHLAFEMHQRGDIQGRELDEFDVRDILRQHPIYPKLAEPFIRLARSRSTLLEERDGQYRFIHLAFQEFLVASYLADVKGGEGGYNAIATFLEQGSHPEPVEGPLLDNWWREPILLISGYFSIDKPLAAQKFLRRLAGLDDHAAARAATLPPDILLAAAELAGAAALEWPALPAGLQGELAGRLVEVLTTPAASNPILRARAADTTLIRLGDPRPGVGIRPPPGGRAGEGGVPDIQFCYVPPGPFWLGSPDSDNLAYNREKPLTRFDLTHGYYIGQYPVTVAQFRAFVEAGGYQPDDDRWQRLAIATHPVVYVTWYEAVAFCEWLTKIWQKSGMLSAEWAVRLPSEAEWKKQHGVGWKYRQRRWWERWPSYNRSPPAGGS